jgi:hypothetical protein
MAGSILIRDDHPAGFVGAVPMAPIGKMLKRELRRPHWEGMDRQIH